MMLVGRLRDLTREVMSLAGSSGDLRRVIATKGVDFNVTV